MDIIPRHMSSEKCVTELTARTRRAVHISSAIRLLWTVFFTASKPRPGTKIEVKVGSRQQVGWRGMVFSHSVGLSLAKPYSYEKDGIVYNGLPRDEVSEQNEAAVEARGIILQRANAADCLDSYNLIATGTGPSPTGRPDPNFDFFDFCSSYIRPTKTYTVTLRSSTPPAVVTVTVTATRSSTKPTVTLFPTSTIEPPVVITVTVTATRSSSKPIPTTTKEEEPPVVTVTVTATKSSIKPTTSSIPPVFVTVTVTATATKSSSSTTKSTTSLPPLPTTTSTSTSTTSKLPPTTSTTSTTSLGITRTQSSTISSSSTSQVPPPTTTTSSRQQPAATGTLCPTPIAGQRCGNPGWGYAENNLYSGSPIDAGSCSQLCLANPDCKSFQTQDSSYESPQCNLYRVDSSGNNTIAGAAPYIFYDRGCEDFAPISCSKSSPPATTAQATLSVGFGLVERQRGRERSKILPWFLEPFDPDIISQFCSCLVTAVPPAIGFTTTIGW
ncbi:hypothetical protein VTL71DRAFT_13950 [Oculimacula yallundae]|uniref:Apple domain-containing protein n=1 Tax=Oculimacula yallundae TaxID=86028 RepID=A0ABR4CPD0_9HELO